MRITVKNLKAAPNSLRVGVRRDANIVPTAVLIQANATRVVEAEWYEGQGNPTVQASLGFLVTEPLKPQSQPAPKVKEVVEEPAAKGAKA